MLKGVSKTLRLNSSRTFCAAKISNLIWLSILSISESKHTFLLAFPISVEKELLTFYKKETMR